LNKLIARISNNVLKQTYSLDQDSLDFLKGAFPADQFIETEFFGGPDALWFDGTAVVPIPPCPGVGYFWNTETATWDDLRSLDFFRARKWDEIKSQRTKAEYAGFTWDGSRFDSDQLSQQRITGAVSLAMLSTEFTIDWTLADNTVRTLSQTSMIQAGVALGTHVATQFAIGVALRNQIYAATTTAEVEAIAWPAT